MVVKRGDMFYADLSPVVGSEQGGIRPVLIIQNDLGNNCLDLNSFIEDYKQDEKAKFEEKDTEIIMKASSNIENIYIQEKILHIDKKTMNPTQMEIKDNQQRTTIYILYNEVKVNSTK